MSLNETKLRYESAVTDLVKKIKTDKNVIAVIVCGSLSYDQVWEKSDIDMTIVIRDQPIQTSSYCLDENNIIINADIVTRSAFLKMISKADGGSFLHSYFAKGKMVYTTDESLAETFEDAKAIGSSDLEVSMMFDACGLLGYAHKIEKWLTVKNDIQYSRFYILKAAESIAHMEVSLNNEPPTREAILRASELNPPLMQIFYNSPLNNQLTYEQINQTLKDIYNYIDKHIAVISAPILEYMSDGEAKTITMITKFFHTDGHYLSNILEYLDEKNIIQKITQTIRITPKGRQVAEEVAYIYLKS